MQPYEHPPRRQGWSARRSLTVLAALGIAVSTCVAAADTAQALAPANDNFADRVAIAKDVAVDLNFAEATREPVIDTEAGLAACGFDLLDVYPNYRTLWFDFTPTVAETVAVSFGDVARLAVTVTGDPGAFTGAGCSGGSFFDVIPGVTYHVAVVDAFGTGVTSTMSIATVPPLPTINATVDPYGTVDPVNNIVSVSGSYTCTSDGPTTVNIFGRVQQTSGPFYATAGVEQAIATATCDGAPHPWSAQTSAVDANGLFRAAPISVQIDAATACNFRCASGTTPATTVRLKSVNGSLTPPPPPPVPTSLKVTVDRSPVLDRATNVVTLSGTFSCTGGDEAFISGRLRQVANNGIFIDAYLDADLGPCTGSTQPWTATLTQRQFIEDVFAGGAASLDAEAYTCGIDPVCSYPVFAITPVSIKAIGQRGRPGAAPSTLPTGVAVNFDHRALLDTANNAVTVTGTIACSSTSEVSIYDSEIGQLVGRVNVRGFDHGIASLSCDGIPQKFSFQAVGVNGRFSPGKATVSSLMFFQTVDPQGFIDSFNVGIARGDLRLVKAKK